jgi:hypothetical protein
MKEGRSWHLPGAAFSSIAEQREPLGDAGQSSAHQLTDLQADAGL